MDVSFSGVVVRADQSDHAILFALSDGATLSVEAAFRLENEAGVRHEVDPETPNDLGPLLSHLVGQTVVSCSVNDNSGEMTVLLHDGSKLSLPSDPSYEAWQARTSDNTLIVCGPGGNLSIWSSPSPPEKATNP